MVLGTLNAGLVVLHLEVDLGIHPGVEVVVGDNLLRLGINHLLGRVDLDHPVNDGDDPVEARTREAPVLAESLNESLVRGTDNSDAREEDH